MIKNPYLKITTIVAFMLLIPFVAMQFTTAVNWSLFDFIIAGALLFGTGLLMHFAWRKAKNKQYRYLLITVILLVLCIVWAELAVGVFGTPFAGS